MPRILWFALGAIAGTAYASSLIHAQRLDVAPGSIAMDDAGLDAKSATKGPDVQAMKEKLAERLEEGAIRISGFIEEKAHDFADALRGTVGPIEPIADAPVDSLHSAPRTTVMAGSPTLPPIAHTAFSEGGAVYTSTATEVLEAPFTQTDPNLPPVPILTETTKAPVMLDRTSDQAR